MATITSAALGNGNGSYTTDIVVKDLDMTVSNYVKDRTPCHPRNAENQERTEETAGCRFL